CTTDSLVGSACTARCTHAPITTPANNDGCCPRGANANNDNDCAPVCGNGVVESGEQCDDGNTTDGDGCSHDCQTEVVPPTAFRLITMVLADPNIYVNSLGCSQLTSFVNDQLAKNLTGDSDNNGLYDLAPVLVFRPLQQHAASSELQFFLGDCHTGTGGTCSAGMAQTVS